MLRRGLKGDTATGIKKTAKIAEEEEVTPERESGAGVLELARGEDCVPAGVHIAEAQVVRQDLDLASLISPLDVSSPAGAEICCPVLHELSVSCKFGSRRFLIFMHRLLSSLASDFGIRFKKHLGYDKDQTSDLVWKRDE